MKTNLESLLNPQVHLLSNKQASPVKGPRAVRLDKGELPFPPSDVVIQALHKAATEINRYPDILGGSLRARLAEYTQTQPEQIIVGNGSDDLIELILKVFVGVGDEVLLPTPTFFIYEFATRVMGGIPVPVPRDAQFDIDIELLLSKSSKRSKVVFLANPNNPTANLIAREKIISLLQRANYMVVVDECYYEIAGETVLDLIDKYPNLIVLRSLSKSFGLAGIRLGYAVANPKTIEYLYRLAQLFPVNKLAIVAGEAALADLAYVQQNIQNICDSRETLKRALEALGSIVYPSSTNFLFVQTNDISSQELVAELAKREIYVADFGGKQGLDNHYWRTSVGSAKENAMLLDALREILA